MVLIWCVKCEEHVSVDYHPLVGDEYDSYFDNWICEHCEYFPNNGKYYLRLEESLLEKLLSFFTSIIKFFGD